MKSTHHLVRVLGLALGLALLMVTGTAAMIGSFSHALPAPGISALYPLYQPLGASPTPELAPLQTTVTDTLLYQPVARSDGGYQWVLIEEPNTTLAKRADPSDAGDVMDHTAGFGAHKVSYAWPAKPPGPNTTIRNCSGPGAPVKAQAPDVYDIRCKTMS